MNTANELESFLTAIEENNSELEDHSVFVTAHNGMAENMQEIDALYVIESDLRDRAVHIHVTWELISPKRPKEIKVDYLTDGNLFKRLRLQVVQKFLDNIADGDYCKRNVEMGLIRLRGWSQLHAVSGVSEVLNATLGRDAMVIISFLEGNEFYKDDDLTYENAWGSW